MAVWETSLGAGAEAVLPRRLSPTAISRYRTCPRQAFYAVAVVAEPRGQPSPVLALGSAMHAALDQLWGVRPDQRSPEVAHRCLRSVWRQAIPRGTFANRDEERHYGQLGLRMLDDFFLRFDTTGRAAARERWVSARLPNGVEVFGKADRIDPVFGVNADASADPESADEASSESGAVGPVVPYALDVIDYKTGRYVIDSDDLPDEPSAQIYLLATEAELGRPVRRVRFLYLAEGAEARWEPEREDVEAMQESLVELTSLMMADRTFEAVPGVHCSRCPFAYLCPEAGRVEVEELEVPDDILF